MDRLWLIFAIFIARLPASLSPSAEEADAGAISEINKSGESPDHTGAGTGKGTAASIRMPEDHWCRALSAAGQRLGIRVVMMDPDSLDGSANRLNGYELRRGRWVRCACRLPDLVYDRCYTETLADRLRCRAALRQAIDSGAVPLSGELPGKLRIYESFRLQPSIAPLLPETRSFSGAGDLIRLFRKLPEGLFLKPSAGMQGRGAIRVRQQGGDTIVDGRTKSNRAFSFRYRTAQEAAVRLERFIGTTPYIVQPLLPLTDSNERPHDVRVLVQKNVRGRWTITGAVCRVGNAGTATSNLHSGGEAEAAIDRLARLYGSDSATLLLDRMYEAALRVASAVEQHYGRYAEFGLDFGLSQDRRLWLLEVNSKPGRQSFRRIGDTRTERLSAFRLLSYARKLAGGRGLQPTADFRRGQFFVGFPSDYVQEVHP